MTECCSTCHYRYNLERLDYSHGGCQHEKMDGFVCMAFKDERWASWMIGVDEKYGMCECYKPKEDERCQSS